jgi:mRNA interferase MazF
VSTKARPGEVWFADLGLAAKNRPVLVLAAPEENDARSLTVVAPLTSQIRNLRGEVELGTIPWLPKLSAVNVQGLASFHPSYLTRKMGRLDDDRLALVKDALRDILDL